MDFVAVFVVVGYNLSAMSNDKSHTVCLSSILHGYTALGAPPLPLSRFSPAFLNIITLYLYNIYRCIWLGSFAIGR